MKVALKESANSSRHSHLDDRKFVVAVNESREMASNGDGTNFQFDAKIWSMKNKPFIFTLLSVLCLIEPAIKVLYFKATTHFDFVVILSNLRSRNTFFEVFDFWLVFPIAGLLLIKLRKWTYFAFLSMLSYIMYNIMTYERYTWPYNAEAPFFYNYLVVALAAAVFVYFLMPKTREPFFDRRVRWWEPQQRHTVFISCKVHGPHLTFPSTILNISQSGAFLESSPYLKVGDRLELEFHFLGQTIEVPVEVVHHANVKGKTGFGVQFKFRNFTQGLRMAKVMNVLKKSSALFNEAEAA